MNSSHLFFLTFSWSFLLLLGLGGNGNALAMTTSIQTTGDTTEVANMLIDIERSLISWKGTEMWETGRHEGTVNLSEGYLLFNAGQIVGGRFIANMNSIAITDIPKDDPIPRRNLRNHLKSEDFFYVKEYPTAEFEITETEVLKADSLRVWGELSIRDVTKAVSFTAYQKSNLPTGIVFYATIKIDRFEWNISYQGSYWGRITSILDDTFVDADIQLSVKLATFRAE